MDSSVFIYEKFRSVTTFIFDVDGVLTDGGVMVNDEGEQMRTFNIKDGYALQLAVKSGYQVAIISGGKSEGIRKRMHMLGITDVFLGAHTKSNTYKAYSFNRRAKPENTLYMGDDIPDIEVMNLVGLPVCPADACEEVKALSQYISPRSGGKGCVRDVIEKVMKLQGTWAVEKAMSW